MVVLCGRNEWLLPWAYLCIGLYVCYRRLRHWNHTICEWETKPFPNSCLLVIRIEMISSRSVPRKVWTRSISTHFMSVPTQPEQSRGSSYGFVRFFSLISEHSWNQNVVRTKKRYTKRSRVCHWCSYHNFTLSVIIYCIDPSPHGIYFFIW